MTATAARTPFDTLPDFSPEAFTAFGEGRLPGLLHMEVLSTEPHRLTCRAPIRPETVAPHGFVHGGTLVSVADSLCGYGTIVNLPAGAVGFLTIELTSNFLGSIRDGAVRAEATPQHLGRTTQVWDATVSDERTGRILAIFRCTQLVLWSEPSGGSA